MLRRVAFIGLLALVCVGASASFLADEALGKAKKARVRKKYKKRKATKEAKSDRTSAETAKKHNADARKLFNLGKFEEAALEYERAYDAKAVPEFLHNIGQCYKRLHGIQHKEKAIFYFESYMNNAPDTPNRQDIEAEIAALKQKIEALRQAKRKEEQQKAQAAAVLAAPASTPEKQKPKTTPFYKKWWFWTAVGVVVAGATTATAVALQPEDESWVTGTIPPGQVPFD